MDFIQFVAVEGDVIDLWYIPNSGGEGPSYHIQLSREENGWEVDLKELPSRHRSTARGSLTRWV